MKILQFTHNEESETIYCYRDVTDKNVEEEIAKINADYEHQSPFGPRDYCGDFVVINVLDGNELVALVGYHKAIALRPEICKVFESIKV